MSTDTKPNTRNSKMQPLVAMRALKALIDDPQQTDQVFVIIKAMSGDALEKAFVRFEKTKSGQQILGEQRELLDTLIDRDQLREHGAGSMAHAYLKFVDKAKITADGLVEASKLDDNDIEHPGLRRFAERMRDQHDLWHVVTGYGSDTSGEACLLAFTYAQTKNRGVGIIALVGMVKLAKELGPRVRTAMWQAYKAGKRAAWLPQQDWEGLLLQPLDEVRQQLNIPTPETYREVFNAYQLANA